MSPTPYVMFPFDEIRSLVAERCPTGDLSGLHEELEPEAERIKALPLDHPERQLLALLRLRATFIWSPLYRTPDRFNDLHMWMMMQSGCPLSA
jgi:hypothetical protein